MEEVWEPSQLREAAGSWGLRADGRLLALLNSSHAGVLERSGHTTSQLQRLLADIGNASLALKNVNNRFMALNNTQFVESRVQEDEAETVISPAPNIVPATPQGADNEESAERNRQAVARSVRRLEGLCERVSVSLDSDSDSDSDEKDITENVLLRPQDCYESAPLPYIIGSHDWQRKWHIGLQEGSSGSESDSGEVPEEPEELHSRAESLSLPPASTPSPAESSVGLTERDPLQPPEPKIVAASASDFAAELARKLGGPAVSLAPAAPAASARPPGPPSFFPAAGPTSQRDSRNIFSDEPPPLEAERLSDDVPSDMFADEDEQDDFLSDGLFGEKPSSKNPQKPGSFNSGLFGNKPEPEYRGLFDDLPDDEDLFSTATNKPQPKKKEAGMFDDSKESTKSTVKKQSNSDLFSKNKIEDRKVSIQPTIKNDSIFNDYDDDDDIRTFINPDVKSSLVADSTAKTNTSGLFDDSDNDGDSGLFGGKNIAKTSLPKPTAFKQTLSANVNKQENVPSLFDESDDDDLFASLKKSLPSEKTKPMANTSTKAAEKGSKLSQPGLPPSQNPLANQTAPVEGKEATKPIEDVTTLEDNTKIMAASLISKRRRDSSSTDTENENDSPQVTQKVEIPRHQIDINISKVNAGKEVDREYNVTTKKSGKTQDLVKRENDLQKTNLEKHDNATNEASVDFETAPKNIEKEPERKKEIKRTNSLFDDVPPPIEETATKSAHGRDINSLFDDDDDSDDLFSSVRNYDKGKKGIFHDKDISSQPSHINLFSDEPPDIEYQDNDESGIYSKADSSDDNIFSNPKLADPTDAPGLFDDYPYFKTVNIIKKENNEKKVTDPSSSKNKTLFGNTDDGGNLFSSIMKTDESDVKIDKKESVVVDSNRKVETDQSKSELTSAISKPIITSKPNIATSKPDILANKPKLPEISVAKTNIATVKPQMSTDTLDENSRTLESFITKQDNNTLRSGSLPTKPDIISEKPGVSSAKPSIIHNKPSVVKSQIKQEDINDKKPKVSLDKPAISSTKPGISVVKSDTNTTKREVYATKSNVSSPKPEVSAIKPNVSAAKPEVSLVKPDISPTKPDTSAIKAKTSVTKPEILNIDGTAADNEISIVEPDFDGSKPSDISAKPAVASTKPTEDEDTNSHKPHGDLDKESEIEEKAFSTVQEIREELSKASKEETDGGKISKSANLSPGRSIGKLQKNLNINVKALIPGIAPKLIKDINQERENVPAEEDSDSPKTSKIVKAVSFEQETQSLDSILSNNISKERVKIPVKRRPSSRRARHEAIRKSAADISFSFEDAAHDEADFTVSLPNSPTGEESKAIVTLPQKYEKKPEASLDLPPPIQTLDNAYKDIKKESSKEKIDTVKDKTKLDFLNDLETEDLFDIFRKDNSANKINTDAITVKDNNKKSVKAKKPISESKETDVFSSGSKKVAPNKEKTDLFNREKAHNMFGDSEDDVNLFSHKPSSKTTDSIDSLFGKVDTSKTESSSKNKGGFKKSNETKNLFSDSDSDNELFAPKSKDAKKSQKDTHKKTAVSSARKTDPKSLFGEDEGEDIFKPRSSAGQPGSLFGDEDRDQFDLFKTKIGAKEAAMPSTAVKKKPAPKSASVLSSAEVTTQDPLSAFQQD